MKWHSTLLLSGGSLLFFVSSIVLVGRGMTNAAESITLPDIRFSLQQPSYVTEKNPELGAFSCDPTKPECKINFDLSPSFTTGFKTGDYSCEITGIDSAEGAKCNPNTVTFGSGVTEVTFVIRNKLDPTQSVSRKITISNGVVTDPLPPPPTDTGAVSSSGSVTGSGVTESGTIISSGTTEEGQVATGITLPEIRIVFQQATYLLDKNPDLTDFYCDPEKPDCKINFDLSSSFTGGFHESEYLCHIDGIIETESGKCNPNQVTFGSGTTQVTFIITSKSHAEASISRQIFIHNSRVSVESDSGATSTGSNSLETDTGAITDSGITSDSGALSGSGITDFGVTTFTGVFVPEPTIEIQSGLSPELTCEKDECIINLNGESSFGTGVRMSDYSCLWSFSGAKSAPSLESCNLSYIHYAPVEYDVTFRITSRSYPEYSKEKSIHIRNVYALPGVVMTSSSSQGGASIALPQAVITPQGPWSKNKYVENNAYICHTETGTCSINFTGENSTAANKSKLKYLWTFGNGETSSVENPGSIIMKTGNYLVSLRVTDELGNSSESIYAVMISSRILDTVTSVDPNAWMLSISRVNPNPSGSDLLEWMEIRNRSSNPIALQGCFLSDASGKKYYFSSSASVSPDESKKWFSGTTGISLTNSKDVIVLTCGEREISRIAWNFPIPDDYILESEYQDVGRDTAKIIDISADGTWQMEIGGARKSIKLRGIDFDCTSVEILARIRAIFLSQSVSVEYEKDDREAVYFFLGDNNIGEQLISEGMARYVPTPVYKYQKNFEKASLEAKKNLRGFWLDEFLSKEATKKINAEKKNIVISEDDPEAYVAWLMSASGSQEKRAQFLEKMTIFSIRSEKNGSTTIYGKGFSGSELEIVIQEDATGSLFEEHIFTGSVSQSGSWNIENIILLPGEYVAYIRARLIPTDPFSMLKKQKKFSIETVTEKPTHPKVKSRGVTKKEKGFPGATFSVSLQAGRSRKIAYASEGIICHDKKCGVNLQVQESTRGAFAYEWDFGDGKKVYGENPKAHIFFTGKHVVMLRALNVETGELFVRNIPVRIIPEAKKPRKKRVAKAKTSHKDKKLNVKFAKAPVSEEAPRDPENLKYLYAFLIISGAGAIGHLAWKGWSVRNEDGMKEESR